MHPTRVERVAQQFQQEIALILQQDFKDPRLGFVTITRVELSKDLRHAKVWFSCLGDKEERERSQEALDGASRFIYGLIKKRLRLKIIPEIVFRYDESIAVSIELSERLDRLKQSTKEPPDPSSPSASAGEGPDTAT